MNRAVVWSVVFVTIMVQRACTWTGHRLLDVAEACDRARRRVAAGRQRNKH